MNRIWLGNRIREAREKRHLTQEKLSEIVDISPTHMSVLERGVKGMKLSTFIKIANALDTIFITQKITIVRFVTQI